MMNVMSAIRRQQESTGLNNLFTAYVIDNNDPERRQRLKVRIPSVHRGIQDVDLPWARKKDGSGAAAGVGEVRIPIVGAKVYVEFRNGNQYEPEYGGTPVSDDVGVEDSFPNYPNSYGWRDQAGNVLIFDPTDGQNTITIGHASGAVIRIGNNGEITITAATNITMEAQTDINFKAGGNISIQAMGEVDVRGSTTKIQGSTVSLRGNIKATNEPTPGEPPQASPSAPSAVVAIPRPVIPSPANNVDA